MYFTLTKHTLNKNIIYETAVYFIKESWLSKSGML